MLSDNAAGLQEYTEEACLSLTELIKFFPNIKNFQNLSISTLRKCIKIAILLFFMFSNCE